MKLVIGNQKSYLEKKEIDSFKQVIKDVNKDNFILCPSSIYLNEFSDLGLLLGCQNVSKYDKGATTGELSCEQIKSIGVNFCIVGHSERRQLFNETIEDTKLKVSKLLENCMTPILCVGETKEERDNLKTREIVLNEIEGALDGLNEELLNNIIIAYEPIWSIGTGVIPSNPEIEEITKAIKEFLYKKYNCNNKVLYGGSVSCKNIDELNLIDIVDGYLIGGASTKANELIEIIKKCE
ncbi:MAG: triose-phosphate isomerase [Bacilli bacterium]|nr:triose-phosphate isomerase [Bacilli bacterium]